MKNKHKIVKIVTIMLTLSVLALMSVPMATALDANVQSVQAFANPGKLTSWSQIQAVQTAQINNGKEKESPIKYEIDKEKLKKLKKKPFVSSGKPPKIEKDKSVTKQPTTSQPNLISGFEGLSNLDQTSGYIYIPPDPDLAAGPDYIGTIVNAEVAFYLKDGTMVGKADLPAWFSDVYTGCGNCFVFDPKIAYDQDQGHWLILALGVDFTTLDASYLLSVSQTSDPTGGWWNYNLGGNLWYDNTLTWADYPDLGFDVGSGGATGAVYLTSNQFDASDLFHTSMLNILPKTALYSGSGFGYWQVFGFGNSDGSRSFTLRTTKTLSTPKITDPPTEYLINSKSGGGNSLTLWKVIPAFPPKIPKISSTNIPISAYSPAPDAKQPGCTAVLDTIDNRLFNAVSRNGHVYTAFTEAYNWGTGTVAAIRYLDIDTVSNAATLDTRYGADKLYYFFPAITTDSNNNIIFTFARSGSSEFSGVRYTGKKTTDPSAGPSVLLKAGQECITGYRWGDYFGIGNDPVNTNRVWIYGEYARNIGLGPVWDWGTYVGQVSN